jgi:hypothetical protein
VAFGHKDMESVEKPIGWHIIEGCGLQSRWMNTLNFLLAEAVTPLEVSCAKLSFL